MEHATFALVRDEVEATSSSPRASYDHDVHAWAMQQAESLRLGRFHELDVENLADEVEDVARRERRELVSRLGLVYQHLLKWEYQRERRSASWARTIQEQRTQVGEVLADNGSLRRQLDALSEIAYRQGRVAALNETDLPDQAFPASNPYSWDDVMTRPVVWLER